jgi:hypothetical protein
MEAVTTRAAMEAVIQASIEEATWAASQQL